MCEKRFPPAPLNKKLKSMIRDSIKNNCPSNDYFIGNPNGTCYGDGHYLCKRCKCYRKDFAEDPTFRELVLSPAYMTFITFNHNDNSIIISELK